jgi:hypothetical protein
MYVGIVVCYGAVVFSAFVVVVVTGQKKENNKK